MSVKTSKVVTNVVLAAVLVISMLYALGEYGFALAFLWPLEVGK